MAPSGKTKSIWDHQADKQLLLAVIDFGKGAWEDISGKMNDKGYEFSKEACRQHYQKIRKEDPITAGTPTSSSKAAGGKASALASTAATSGQKRKTAGKGKGKQTEKTMTTTPNQSTTYEPNSDDAEDWTPSKKAKLKKEETDDGQSATQFKMENSGEIIDLDEDDLYEH